MKESSTTSTFGASRVAGADTCSYRARTRVRARTSATGSRRRRGHGAYAPHRNLRQRSFRAFARSAHCHHLGEAPACDHARRDAIHPHAEFAELERELAGERHHAGLRHCIGAARAFGAGRDALARGDRGKIDDGAALLLQMRRGRPAGIERGVQIGAEDRAPVLERAVGQAAEAARRRRGEVLRGDAPAAADAVDEDIDAAVLFHRLIDHRIDRRRVGDIRADTQALRQRGEALLIEVGDHDLHAFLEQAERHRVADAVGLRAPSDDCNELHKRILRQKKGPTNILSFPFEMLVG